jgi:hypothetical protein
MEMRSMKWIKDDGGRKAAGRKGKAGDCAVRALAIAAEMEYKSAHWLISDHCRNEKPSKQRKGLSHPDGGVHRVTFAKAMDGLGWKWVPTMGIGTGCRVHLRADELPSGTLIVRLSGHYAAVIDGVVHDIYDPSREGTRCVYGYWVKPEEDQGVTIWSGTMKEFFGG